MTIPPLLLTVEEAADAQRISRSKAYEEVADGRLSSVKIGWCRRVPVEALARYVAGLPSGPDAKSLDPGAVCWDATAGQAAHS
jgi:excisionase family DNA binding protein